MSSLCFIFSMCVFAPQGPAAGPGLRSVGAWGADTGPINLRIRAAWGGCGPDAGCGPGLPQEEALWRVPSHGQSLHTPRPTQVGGDTHTNTHELLKTKHWCSRNTQRHKQADSVTTRHQSCSQWPHIWEQPLVPVVWEWFIGTRWTLTTSNAPQALQARGHTHTWSVSVFLPAWQLPSLFVRKIAKLMHIRYREPAIYV